MNNTKDRTPFLPILLLENKKVILTIITLVIIADIFLIKENSDIRIFVILAVYIASILFYRLKSKFTFLLCFLILASMYVEFVVSGTSEGTEKAAVWFFFFLLIGIVQQFRE